MFSRSLLPLIARHDSSFFGGSEWPENHYGRDGSNYYDRRETLRPLPLEEVLVSDAVEDDDGPNAYIIRYDACKVAVESADFKKK
jgi:hypothetical protein